MTHHDFKLFQLRRSGSMKPTIIPYLGQVEDYQSYLTFIETRSAESKTFTLPLLQTLYMLLAVLLQAPLRGFDAKSSFYLLDYEEVLEFRFNGDRLSGQLSNGFELGNVRFVELVQQINTLLLAEYKLAAVENRLGASASITSQLTIPVWLETV